MYPSLWARWTTSVGKCWQRNGHFRMYPKKDTACVPWEGSKGTWIKSILWVSEIRKHPSQHVRNLYIGQFHTFELDVGFLRCFCAQGMWWVPGKGEPGGPRENTIRDQRGGRPLWRGTWSRGGLLSSCNLFAGGDGNEQRTGDILSQGSVRWRRKKRKKWFF